MTEETKVEREMALEGRVLTGVTEEEVREKGLKKVGDFKCINYTHCHLGINNRFKGHKEIEHYNKDYLEKGEIILYSK